MREDRRRRNPGRNGAYGKRGAYAALYSSEHERLLV
jgi:hypothetical protein